MANLSESAAWSSGIYKIETTDLVLGGDGVNDIANKQAKSLANRTSYLKAQLEKSNEHLIRGILGTYTTNDLIVLWGCVISGSGTKAITEGAIFYNGQVYKVASASGITAGPSYIFAIKSSVDPYEIEFKSGDASTTGFIALWNSSTIKKYLELISGIALVTSFTMLNSYAASGARYYKDVFGNVRFVGNVQSPASPSDVTFANLPVGYRPATAKQFPVGLFGPTQSAVVCYIETNGDCRLYDSTDGNVVDGNKNFGIDPVCFNVNL